MKIVGAVVLLLNLGLSLAVGAKLLRLSLAPDRTPERCLAIYFLLGVFLGGGFIIAAYAGWSDPALGMPLSWVPGLHVAGTVGVFSGALAIYVFTWRTFRRESRFAAAVVALATVVLLGGFAGRCLGEGFAISTDPGVSYWTMYWVRIASLVWVAGESIAYAARMRRRLKLGLVDPMVADRFLLWSVWASASLLAALSEVIARVVFHWMGGESVAAADGARGLAAPIIVVSLTITSTAGMMSATTLFLTFFPTPAYRRWVDRRAGALAG
ncbi:MAG: hypothetical protein ACQGVK_00285 [Myxococcota bacterium]